MDIATATARPAPPTREATIRAMAGASQRTSTPVRWSFVQRYHPAADDSRAGPLSVFARHGDITGLNAFLAVLMMSSVRPYGATYPSQMWARALGLDVASTASAMSKVWRRLIDRKLVITERTRGMARIVPLLEDGSEHDYTRPTARFLRLPDEYWTSGLYAQLSLPEIVVLLIALKEEPGFTLPHSRGPAWYGISRETLQRGFSGLDERGVMRHQVLYAPAPLSATGYREERHYHLQPPYDRQPPGRTPS